MCYSCTVIPPGQAVVSTFSKTLTIIGDPVDCSNSLTDKSFTPSVVAYNSAGSSALVLSDYLTIFSHTLIQDCPIQSCLLMAQGCVPLVAPLANIFIGPSPEYKLSTSEIEPSGYIQNFCYRCIISPVAQATINFQKDLTIIANPLDCSSSLVDNLFVPSPIEYNSVGSKKVISPGYETIFTHS